MPKINQQNRVRVVAKWRSATWVADLLGLTPQTVTEMARRGEIPAFRPRANGWWKFDEDKILAYKKQRETNPEVTQPLAA